MNESLYTFCCGRSRIKKLKPEYVDCHNINCIYKGKYPLLIQLNIKKNIYIFCSKTCCEEWKTQYSLEQTL